jgi:cytochrome c oxidase assembly protein subunit 15
LSDAFLIATPAEPTTDRKLVSAWLFTMCFMIWVMVGIGGYTRDSGSGLSIMNWDPIIGALPPLNQEAWQKLFALYKTIPQYQIEHAGMGLDGFKSLFWPEYIHRLWGRLLGVVFLLPLIAFAITGKIERRLIPWLALLFVLGGLQGAIGWFMVASGFDPNSTAVEPWRLSLHFSAAMFLYVAVFWTAMTVRHPERIPVTGAKTLRAATHAATALLLITMFAGTFVSGTHAITVFNPTTGAGMGAPPPDYFALSPWWQNFFANKAAVLFDHQIIATLTTLALLLTATLAIRGPYKGAVRDAGLAVGGLVIMQFILGVTALASQILDIGVAHQMNAVLLLTACLWMLFSLKKGQGSALDPLGPRGPRPQ